MTTTNPMVPSPDWRLLTVTIPPDTRTFKFTALAPGCINTPHDGTKCGCRMFDRQPDGDTYIRSKIGR